jgi:phosphoenolpyruvate-protein kinase (PTS system EI component)
LRGAQPPEASSALQRLSRQGREESAVTQAVCLPALLLSEEDLTGFEQREAIANFISRRRARADVVCLSGTISPSIDLAGKIVLVANADPGYDWLFARDIAGLITMYGGVNSHMAIRAAEFQLPAAIGVGELRYDRLRKARMIDLDCASRQIRVVG